MELREKGLARFSTFVGRKPHGKPSPHTARPCFARRNAHSEMRRLLHDAIIDWSEKTSRHPGTGTAVALGIRDAYRALDHAVRVRVRRKLRRYRPAQ